MPFVLDNSVVCGWLLENQASPYKEAIAERLQHDTGVAPRLLQLEYTNVLRTACKRQKLAAHQAQDMLEQLQALPIKTDPTVSRPAELLALALRHNLSAYDAVYLDLALHRQIPLATTDTALAAAAKASGVGAVPG